MASTAVDLLIVETCYLQVPSTINSGRAAAVQGAVAGFSFTMRVCVHSSVSVHSFSGLSPEFLGTQLYTSPAVPSAKGTVYHCRLFLTVFWTFSLAHIGQMIQVH